MSRKIQNGDLPSTLPSGPRKKTGMYNVSNHSRLLVHVCQKLFVPIHQNLVLLCIGKGREILGCKFFFREQWVYVEIQSLVEVTL